MKKSEIYYEAALAVIDDDTLIAPQKLEIIELLIVDKNIAEMVEEQEGKSDGNV